MLTAKINNNLINCYDGKYSKEDLKTWASKDIIKCPVCGKSYEYCHGQINTPYFRHKDKAACDYLYSEPETEEHIKGKLTLYNWIKKQDGITNAVLEAWIPETKQRPDIMFEYGGSKWVIEYQCSPIATEQIERHKLYEAGGIKDIWICGVQNYGTGNKHMEKIMDGMFSSKHNKFIEIHNIIRYDLLPYCHLSTNRFDNISLNDLTFKDKIAFTDDAMLPYIEQDKNLQNKKEEEDKQKEHIHSLYELCNTIPKWYEQVWHHCKISVHEGNLSSPYLIMMNFDSDVTSPFTLFVKDDVIDICYKKQYSRRVYSHSSYKINSFRWEKATKFINMGKLRYESSDDLVPVIKEYFSSRLREGASMRYKMKKILKEEGF